MAPSISIGQYLDLAGGALRVGCDVELTKKGRGSHMVGSPGNLIVGSDGAPQHFKANLQLAYPYHCIIRHSPLQYWGCATG